ncbi:MAG: 50S ribosomal protein L10 [Coriobacteriaceae bacterium]|nr:50S ribosomal protein L10 [Coriobacteriaceae bacterium]
MATAEKEQQVEEISEQFKDSAGCWFINSRGLTVKEVQQLRGDIRQAGGHMHVYKNRLAARALAELKLPAMADVLVGPTAFVFCDDDISAPARVIKKFAEDHEALEMKAGLVDGEPVSKDEALRIADLPPKEVLVAQLLSTLQAPLTGIARVCNGPVESFARAVKAIADQKQDEAA